jgi:RNA polymerase sigma-70 factor (ECF subfamily)
MSSTRFDHEDNLIHKNLMTKVNSSDKTISDKAFEELHGKLFKFAWTTVRSHLMKSLWNYTEDIISESFYRLYNYRNRYDTKYSVGSCFNIIIQRTCVDFIRLHVLSKDNIRRNDIYVDDFKKLARSISDIPNSPIEDHETKLVIRNYINNLQEPYKTALHAKLYLDHDYKMIAKTLNVSTRTVENYLSKAKIIIKEQLQNSKMF